MKLEFKYPIEDLKLGFGIRVVIIKTAFGLDQIWDLDLDLKN